MVERLFGVWKRRFPVLAYGLHLKLETTLPAIVACAVLHNIANQANAPPPPAPENIDPGQLQILGPVFSPPDKVPDNFYLLDNVKWCLFTT